MKKFLFILLAVMPWLAFSQSYNLTGEVRDLNGTPLQYATVALLKPSDSTLAYFGITNPQGKFQINRVPSGEYITQVAYIGYQTLKKSLKVPLEGGTNIGVFEMEQTPINLKEVQVTGERVPLLMKQDTVEFNAGAFKTNPDAVAEDLLKRLPGVEVDRSGNIKAMGENVTKVLVDGKEFFSTDPKVATKNLPAESINKVQVFNKKSDEAELLGIDDSEYEKTINIILKDDMKKAIFGDVKGGGGLPEYYQANAKVYRFTDKQQMAALGLLNNVNRIGFSFQDYIDFNGGMRSFISGGGGGGRPGSGTTGSIPVDFGRPVTGKVESGAGGINYSYEIVKDNRLNISYMGNGTNRSLYESSYTKNFTSNRTFEQNSLEDGTGKNRNHLFNLGWRNKASKRQHSMLNGIATLTNSESNSKSITETNVNSNPVNSLDNKTYSNSKQLNTSAEGSWLLKGDNNWKMLKLSGDIRYNQSLSESDWRNITRMLNTPVPVEVLDKQFSNNDNYGLQSSVGVTALRKVSSSLYLEPTIRAGLSNDLLAREQGLQNDVPLIVIDSLSPRIERQYEWVRPRLLLKKYSKKIRYTLGAELELSNVAHTLDRSSDISNALAKVLPQAMWEYEYKAGARINVRYNTAVTLPSTSQLTPIISNSNPLAVSYGNRNLKPSYRHRVGFNWILFDQFSFTSLFSNIEASYTRNRVNRAITIGENLKQVSRLVNVPDDYNASANINFSTPIRPLGINISIGLNENWNRGINYVNDVSNINTNLSHGVRLRFDNRKKEKWDVEVGGQINYTDARYSIQNQLNRTYFNYSAFSEIRYTPTARWFFRLSADVTKYDDQGFAESITVPLLSGEINYYLTSNKRALLSLEGYDLLNKNTGISRTSELNYLREVRSEMIGRYVLLSLKYRLNKFGTESQGPRVNINIRGM